MAAPIPKPDLSALLAPLLPALPAATISTQPAIGVLPLLSPILRQRVQYLSASSNEPWLRLLCYDTAKAVTLAEIAKGGGLEPHPVSGEVEIDWDYDADTRYRRLDKETFQALVALTDLKLAFRLVYCVGDVDGGGDGWRVGEVIVVDSSTLADFGEASSMEAAEAQFKAGKPATSATVVDAPIADEQAEDDDDGGYWDQYDATPSQTPAKETPPPPSKSQANTSSHPDMDDDYYAQYDHVQPAMDNHDPDEEAHAAQIAPPLGLGPSTKPTTTEPTEANETHGSWTLAEPVEDEDSEESRRRAQAGIVHPRPDSSASSNGSRTVAKLEATADRQDQSEFGVKQHVARSIRSLFILCRSSGIDREEFDRMIKSELDVLALIEDQV
ncbi:hypothetical protein B0I35DRAFT_473376 [Stachybotrys elegans]|uniref:Uncharacterized protein n=1 Tax=Stachybotrys elegans TaxID=80388 RepID=A0A8K0WYA7_9HYPO|nr:hypothetical protein B0I35DRAFT_473376 [Stachybotrys elegans]